MKFINWKLILRWILLFLVGMFLVSFCSTIYSKVTFRIPSNKTVEKVPYSKFTKVVDKTFDKKKVQSLTETDKGKLYYYDGKKYYETQIPYYDSSLNGKRTDEATQILDKHNLNYDYREFDYLMLVVFICVVGMSITTFIFIGVLLKEVLGEKKENELEKKVSKFTSEIPKVKLDEIGGLSPQVMEEIDQTIILFKKAKEATDFKIKPINGILLSGPPGTGKTMLAKAIANNLDASYFQVNGPEFVEKYIGVGALRVRELFADAKKNQPSVVFIDEIDAVGQRRDGEINSEARSTLNQLLIELSEIQNQQVLVIASTNHSQDLDAALTRPGRFDYKITIDLPDIKGRQEIIKIKTQGIKLEESLEHKLDDIARSMYRMSGADIEDVFQKAQIKALMSNRDFITYDDVQSSIERVILGTKGRIVTSENVLKRVAFHEAGHALLSSIYFPGSVQKATIVPYSGSLGLVLSKESEDNSLKTRSELLHKIQMLLAGGVSERIFFVEHSVGVSQDFDQAKQLAETMVTKLGMTLDDFSFTTTENHQDEIKRILDHCFAQTQSTIENHKVALNIIAKALLEEESLSGEEIDTIVTENLFA
ncbi:AAA family ATPase [Bacillus toyonensis]|uniref:AAA family ATPase n=1 Tax=Bacillus toyonensis TaxID=155322 RepID=UPI002E1D641B|nr:AAA family ATPase [Bacillus toyonensis]MED2737415.1 AAA family ATPase [Bacillus toyonensis]